MPVLSAEHRFPCRPSRVSDFDESAGGIGAYFLRAASAHPDRCFVDSPETRLTFDDAVELVAQMVASLHAAGLRRGDKVACYSGEQVPLILFMLACALGGVLPCPVSPVFSHDFLMRGVVQRLGVRHVFTAPAHARPLAALGLIPMIPMIPRSVTAQDAVPGVMALTGAGAALRPRCARELLDEVSAQSGARDPLVIATTSGSTGLPRLVVRRHLGPLRYAQHVGDALRDGRAEVPRMLLVAALTHAFGLHMFTTALRLGATLCVPTRLDTAASLEEIRALDPSILPLVPRVQRALYLQVCARDPSARVFGSGAEVVCSAGGPPNAAALGRMQADGLEILELYGSTEASLVALTPRGAWHPGRAGRPVPDADVAIAPDGEILVKSPGLFVEYYGDAEATRAAMTADGYFRMGDLGRIHADGYLEVAGRKATTFKLSEGSSLYPERIEDLLEGLPWVHQAILVGDDRPYLVALIVLAPDSASVASPGEHGHVPPGEAAASYRQATAALCELNRGLERLERVVRVALFVRPFCDAIYAPVGGAKIRRDRSAVEASFAPILQALYAGPASADDPTCVPDPECQVAEPHLGGAS
jgi:long-chain acyl-CoA synthetase